MNKSKLIYLYQRYLDDTCTTEELQELDLLLNNPAYENNFIELLDSSWDKSNIAQSTDLSESKADQIYLRIIQTKPQHKTNSKLWIRIAAVFLLTASVGLLFYTKKTNKNTAALQAKTEKQKTKTGEIMPGSNKAVLTLGNGKTVILDDSQIGQIAAEPGVKINKVKDGQLSYAANGYTSSEAEQNTMDIPKGGQYHITLPDGTEVFLNAGSTLSYPTRFAGKNRKVTLKGEAYFEVKKNPEMPFLVNVNNRQQIEVLGTHFNVKAYPDESMISTTLLEGSVKVVANHQRLQLKPGQAAINNLSGSLSVVPADLDEAMAWKNGLFVFNNENITTVMKKISRWYDVDVVFKGDLDNINFTGNYSRSKSLNNLFKNIELMEKVHFHAEGRRITVIAN